MSVSGNATFERAALTRRASLRRPHEQPTILRLQRSASRHAQRHEPPARTQVRSDATWARGAWPSKDLARTFSAEGGRAGRSPPFGARPEQELERPFSLMIRHILRLDATMPDLSRATFSLRAPYPPRDPSKAPSTSGSIGSGAFGRGGCASMR